MGCAELTLLPFFELTLNQFTVLKEGDNVANLAQALVDKIDCGLDHRKAFSPYQGYVFQYIGMSTVLSEIP